MRASIQSTLHFPFLLFDLLFDHSLLSIDQGRLLHVMPAKTHNEEESSGGAKSFKEVRCESRGTHAITDALRVSF